MTTDEQYMLTTEEFAKLNGIRGHSVRMQVYRTGSYFDVVPKKLVNRRLMWPEVQVVAKRRGGEE